MLQGQFRAIKDGCSYGSHTESQGSKLSNGLRRSKSPRNPYTIVDPVTQTRSICSGRITTSEKHLSLSVDQNATMTQRMRSMSLDIDGDCMFSPAKEKGLKLHKYWAQKSRSKYYDRRTPPSCSFVFLMFSLALLPTVLILREYLHLFEPCGLDNGGSWAVGIAYGNSPFNLTFSDNPAVTCSNIKDIPAAYVSGAFLIPPSSLYSQGHPGAVSHPSHTSLIGERHRGSNINRVTGEDKYRENRDVKTDEWLMFFEVKNNLDYKGGIGLARSNNGGGHWIYDKIVLDEYFHMAYPFVFRDEGWLYMIPSTREIDEVRLYRATSEMADDWDHIATLLSGTPFIDTSVVYFEGRWWMYTWTKKPSTLHLYYSAKVTGPWIAHPMSPLDVKKHNRRPGGRPVVYDGMITRFSVWGSKLEALQVEVLNTTHYQERKLKKTVKADRHKHWISKRVQTLDAHELSPGVWVAGIDGDSQRSKPVTRMFVRWIVLWVVFTVLSLVVMKVNIFKPMAKSIRKVVIRIRGYKRMLQQCNGAVLFVLALCVWVFGLWRLDWLLDCHLPTNVAHFQGVGTLCLGDVGFYIEKCSQFVESVNVSGLHGPEGLNDVYSRSLSYVGPSRLHTENLYNSTAEDDQMLVNSTSQKEKLVVQNGYPTDSSLGNGEIYAKCEVTLITAMIDLSPYMGKSNIESKALGRSFEVYKAWFLKILALNSCMVVYVQSENVNFVWEHRSAFNTIVRRIPADVVRTYKHIDKIKAILANATYTGNVRRPDRIEMKVPAYSVTQYKKVDWVYEATTSNTFQSEFFFWIDGGYGHGKRMPDLQGEVWPNPVKVRSVINPYQVFIVQVDDPVHEHCFDIRSKFMRHESTMAGGFFGGTKETMHRVYTQFHVHLDRALSAGYMDDDQAVFFSMWCQNPNMFQLERCPSNLLCKTVGAVRCFDRWNCAPQIFAKGGIHDRHIFLYQWIGS
eukprot:CFRG0382T1